MLKRWQIGIFYMLIGSFAFSQNPEVNVFDVTVNISRKEMSLKEFFEEIEKQTDYLFVYSKEDFNAEKVVKINSKNKNLKNTLDEVLSPLGLTAEISKKYITVRKNTAPEDFSNPNDSIDSSALSKIHIMGNVFDEGGEAIAGVSVIESGTDNGSHTDVEGKFQLLVAPNAKLIVKRLGYVQKELKIREGKNFSIMLQEDIAKLAEVIVVGYGTQQKLTLAGAIGTIDGDAVRQTNQPSIKAGMSGKLAGIRYIQTNGEPGNDGGKFDIRGFGEPYTIVDGVERPFSQLDPNEIESISVLKDASAAVFGFRGANGVIIVTTKKGVTGKPKINYSFNYSMQNPVKHFEMMNAYEYAYYRNQGELNANPFQTPQWSQTKLDIYKTGYDSNNPDYKQFNPEDFNETNWWNEAVRSNAPKQTHNLNISGGNRDIKYFFSLGYLNQEGILRTDQDYSRYNFRSNISANISRNFFAEVGIGGRIQNTESSYYLDDEGVKVFEAIYSTPPVQPVYANNNPLYYQNTSKNMLNPMAMLDKSLSGYKKREYTEFNSQIGLTYEIIKGLKLKAFAAYDKTEENSKDFKKDFSAYTYNSVTKEYVEEPKVSLAELEEKYDPYVKTTQQYSINYATVFNKAHNVGAMLLYEQKQSKNDWMLTRGYLSNSEIDQMRNTDVEGRFIDGNLEETLYKGIVGRFNYIYSGKYLFEFSFREDGSNKNAPNRRWGFFPAFSGGWIISDEPFFKNKITFVDNLKIRGSWGRVGDDSGLALSNFLGGWLYPQGSYILGENATGNPVLSNGSKEANMANPWIFWYTVETTDIGMEANLWNGLLSLEFDRFYCKRTGLFGYRKMDIPTTAAIPVPQENINSDDNRGFELSIGSMKKFGNVDFSVKGNVSYSRAKDLHWETYRAPNQYVNYMDSRDGRWKNYTFGYVSLGQFQSYEEILSSPIQDESGNTTLRPGDIKYKDLNGDGIINELDQKVIGKSEIPDVNFGLDFTVSCKNLDLNVLFQGASNYTYIPNALRNPFRGPDEGNGFAAWMDSWHKADYNDPYSEWVPGKFPSIRLEDNANNDRISTFWTTDAYYVRLKSIELGYTLPKAWVKKLGINSCRIFTNGYNLLTITNIDYVDPEAAEGWMSFYYPQLRVISFGCNINF